MIKFYIDLIFGDLFYLTLSVIVTGEMKCIGPYIQYVIFLQSLIEFYLAPCYSRPLFYRLVCFSDLNTVLSY